MTALALPPPSVISSFRTDLAIALMGGNVHSEVALTVLILSTIGNPKVCPSTATERPSGQILRLLSTISRLVCSSLTRRDSTPTGMAFLVDKRSSVLPP